MLKHTRASESWHEKNIGQKGFTLIELLVVIIILGILAGIVVLSVTALRDTSEATSCTTERKTTQSAAAAFYADQDPNAYPADAQELFDDDYLDEMPDTNFTIDATTGQASACP